MADNVSCKHRIALSWRTFYDLVRTAGVAHCERCGEEIRLPTRGAWWLCQIGFVVVLILKFTFDLSIVISLLMWAALCLLSAFLYFWILIVKANKRFQNS